MVHVVWILGIVIVLLAWWIFVRRTRRRQLPAASPLTQAKRRFHLQARAAEAEFLQLAWQIDPRRPAMDRLHVRRRRRSRPSSRHRRTVGFRGRDAAPDDLDGDAPSNAADDLQAGTATSFRTTITGDLIGRTIR